MSVLYKDKATGNWEKVGGTAVTGFVSGLPDWDHAVSITSAQIDAGYTCPDNGLIVGYNYCAQSAFFTLLINGIAVNGSDGRTSANIPAMIQCPVAKGDILTMSHATYAVSGLSFVPWKK